MSQLTDHIEDYLAMRRALGFTLEKEGRLLPSMVRGFAPHQRADSWRASG